MIEKTANPMVNKKLKRECSFEYFLVKKVAKTIKKYGMIEDGDRILVGVSGGKDSLSLLKILNDRKGFYPYNYEILALHVVFSNLSCRGASDPKALEDYFKKEGYNYKIAEQHLRNTRKGMDSFWCSWNRRRVLFQTANTLGYNKIALAHHGNDVVETTLLNIFYHSEISTMLPVQSLFEDRMKIIRPFYYISESDTRKFSRIHNFPAAHCRCPVQKETKREMFKRLVSEIEKANPKAGISALRALENVKMEYLPNSTVKENITV
ncbi:MAG: tRNA 2-thiocytidine biosynthesis TtcA family protein [Spirochaetota bacterium]